MSRATQSLSFSVIYSIYLLVVMGPVQLLILRPLCALRPGWRPAILRTWFRWQANLVLGFARRAGGLEVKVRGSLPPRNLILLMNHQSLLDIPVGVSLLSGPYPVIPTRDRYTRWIPGISGLARLAGFPSLRQTGRASRAEHAAIAAAADAVGRGERTLIIYPEGHRSRDGALLPFMTEGLRLIFRRTRNVPVYLAVLDGLWRLRTFADICLRLAGNEVSVEIRGPFTVPPETAAHPAFIASLEAEMRAALDGMRAASPPRPESASLASRVQPVA